MEKEQLQELIENNKEDIFSEIKDEISDDTVTDIEWDGYNLWITQLGRGCYISMKELSDRYMENLSIRLANIMGASFNRMHPILEANTESLRISIWHESRCGRKSMAIRKIPRKLRFGHGDLVKSDYAPESIITLLDNQEIHYRQINPHSKCVEFFVDSKITYQDIIRAGLRHNIDWVLLSESRGPEVMELLNSLSTGAYCMTTMHLDDIRDMPDRMYSMLGNGESSDRFINSIYKYIDLVLLVDCDRFERRHISQVGFLSRNQGENTCTVIYEDGEFLDSDIPQDIMDKFIKYGIDDPYIWRHN